MNQSVHASLETQSEIARNPVDDENTNAVDLETEVKIENEEEVIIRCEYCTGVISAWFCKRSKMFSILICVELSVTGPIRAAGNVS
jgi:hypothetical protein